MKIFINNTKFNINNNCIEWTGKLDKDGYGFISINSDNIKAHRLFYELFKDKIPYNKVIDHLCRNPKCVNFEHLEAVTVGTNTRRGINHNRNKTHCKFGHLLTEDNIYRRKNRNSRECKICISNRFK